MLVKALQSVSSAAVFIHSREPTGLLPSTQCCTGLLSPGTRAHSLHLSLCAAAGTAPDAPSLRPSVSLTHACLQALFDLISFKAWTLPPLSHFFLSTEANFFWCLFSLLILIPVPAISWALHVRFYFMYLFFYYGQLLSQSRLREPPLRF